MGDRALVVFKSGVKDTQDFSPVIYLHWYGSKVAELLQETRNLMAERIDDVAYTAARFVGIAHSKMADNNISLGIWNLPDRGTSAERLELIASEDFSHGDAGVFLVDVKTEIWNAVCFNGYGFNSGWRRPVMKKKFKVTTEKEKE